MRAHTEFVHICVGEEGGAVLEEERGDGGVEGGVVVREGFGGGGGGDHGGFGGYVGFEGYEFALEKFLYTYRQPAGIV